MLDSDFNTYTYFLWKVERIITVDIAFRPEKNIKVKYSNLHRPCFMHKTFPDSISETRFVLFLI